MYNHGKILEMKKMCKQIIETNYEVKCGWCKQELAKECDKCGEALVVSVYSQIFCHDEGNHYCANCAKDMETVTY
jgi:hypothetical protein